MARARFIAPGHTGHTSKTFGRDFPHGEWVDLDGMDPKHVEILAANPTFEVEAEKKARGGAAAGAAGAA